MPASPEFKKRKEEFCKKNRTRINRIGYICSSMPVKGWWQTKSIMNFLDKARSEIGYSPKTVDIDIINSLFKTVKKYNDA